MLELALHLLDIVENSTRAGAKNITITVREQLSEDLLFIEIRDDGQGMDEQARIKALDPFYTTKKVRRVGLGLPMLSQAAERTGGGLILESIPGKGTTLSVTFGLRHIDRQPMGDVAGTMVTLIAGNPDTHFIYEHDRDHHVFRFDTAELLNELGSVPINHIEILKYIRQIFIEGLQEIHSEA
ncbi:MAG: sensor histidine kinase [Syntrophales bacterium]|nr:sensor histidine kinase [Syntrophales bacterium]